MRSNRGLLAPLMADEECFNRFTFLPSVLFFIFDVRVATWGGLLPSASALTAV